MLMALSTKPVEISLDPFQAEYQDWFDNLPGDHLPIAPGRPGRTSSTAGWERFQAHVSSFRFGGNMFGFDFDLVELGIAAAVVIVITGGLAVVVSLARWIVHLRVMEEQIEDQLELLFEIRKELARVVTLLDR